MYNSSESIQNQGSYGNYQLIQELQFSKNWKIAGDQFAVKNFQISLFENKYER